MVIYYAESSIIDHPVKEDETLVECDLCKTIIGHKKSTGVINSTPKYFGELLGYRICIDCAESQFNIMGN
jgi:hypothetical protein